MTIELTQEVRASLTDAGIGPRFQDMKLEDVRHGKGMLDYLKQYGNAVRREGHSIAFHGIGLTDTITMLARALHLAGTGCRIVPLVRMGKITRDAEFREIVTEIDVLIITAGADSRRPCPLQAWVMADLEELIRARQNRNQATFIHLAINAETAVGSLDTCYWSDEFLELLEEQFDHVTPANLDARTRA